MYHLLGALVHAHQREIYNQNIKPKNTRVRPESGELPMFIWSQAHATALYGSERLALAGASEMLVLSMLLYGREQHAGL